MSLPSELHTEEYAAPGELELVRMFVNTTDVETGQEGLDSVEALGAWMESQGLDAAGDLDEEDLETAIAFREGLRGMLLANGGAELSADALDAVRRGAEWGTLQIAIDAEGRASQQPSCSGSGVLFARLLAIIAAAQERGEWARLKVCAADDCRWAFYDRSRNRSRSWCAMKVCGNRAKTRTYRARRSMLES
jgi:predicted RNA-binding Zn ribbon-like protein